MAREAIRLAALNVLDDSPPYGRFSGDHVWPLLGVHRGRSGKLLCSQVDSEANGHPAYLIDRASAETKIEEIKQALRSGKLVGSKTVRVVSEDQRRSSETSDALRSTPEDNGDASAGASDMRTHVDSLKAENLNLRAEKRGLEFANEQIMKNSITLVDRLDTRATEAGRLAAERDFLALENKKLRALSAPRERNDSHVSVDPDRTLGESSSEKWGVISNDDPQDIPSRDSGDRSTRGRMEDSQDETPAN